MKIYTKTGDQGFTSLFGGARISKDDIRIESYGTVDELNSFVGALYDVCSIEEVKEQLFIVQNKLFNIGSVLATDPSSDFKLPGVNAEDVLFLEQAIDMMTENVPELKNFILPSGAPIISACHICRTVCRRAERRVITLQNSADTDGQIIIYLNRLSDYFFLLSRYFAAKLNIEEIKWKA
jgi:cob(I)alamin adenosyltransferase